MMAFILWIHIRPSITLNKDELSTTQNKTNMVTGPTTIGSMIYPNEMVSNPLKLVSTLLGE